MVQMLTLTSREYRMGDVRFARQEYGPRSGIGYQKIIFCVPFFV